MARAPFSLRIVLALILLASVAIVCASLGRWQLGRAAEREAIYATIMAGRNLPAVTLGSAMPHSQLLEWRAATASGQWMNRYTVLLDNRNHNGRPGFWVATPLMLDGATERVAIMVLRGWVERPLGPSATLPLLDGTDGTVRIDGELRTHVPRLFDLGSFSGDTITNLPANPADTTTLLRVQNLDLENFSSTTGIKLLPAVLQQTSPATLNDGTALVQAWPTPSLDADKNRGYALQWFAFAAIAAGAWVIIAWKSWRRRSEHRPNALLKD